MAAPTPYLDLLLKLVLRVFANGTQIASVGGGATGLNFNAPLNSTNNAATQNVDVTLNTSTGALSFNDVTLPPEVAPGSPASGWIIYVDSADNKLKAKDLNGNVATMATTIRTPGTIKTLNASNTTANVPIFGITGTVRITKLYGIVTTTIGTNHTASQFRINDQTAQTNLTSAASGALSAAPVGSFVAKTGLAANATAVGSNAIGLTSDSPTAGTTFFCEFIVIKKSTAATNIEYRYTTTDTPTSGAIQFWLDWEPVSADGAVVAL